MSIHFYLSSIMVLAWVLSVLVVILYAVYYVSTLKFDYWEKKKVPHLKPKPFVGNYGGQVLLQKYLGKVVQDLYNQFPDVPYFGAYFGTEPTLIVKDPEILKLVLAKDFYYFSGREVSNYTHHELSTRNIFFSGGDSWKATRQNLTPLFSSAKLKNMFYLIENCAHTFETMLEKYMQKTKEFEGRNIMAKYTISGISSCAFGIDSHTMDQPDNNPFVEIADTVFKSTTFRGIKFNVRAIWPAIFYSLGLKIFPTQLETFFTDLLTGIFKERGYKPSSRNDFVDQILTFHEKGVITGDSLSNMKTGDDKKVNIKVDNEFLVAQCILFFAAGFEAAASNSSFTLYELAKKPEVQKKVHEEIDAYLKKNNNQITYDCIKELPYLDACSQEAMRLYPVQGALSREVIEDYTLPSGLTLDKKTRVHIPMYALHHDPNHFPNPEEFQPERFLPENKHNIKPFTYLPFGEGSRTCLGMRFAKMMLLPGLITLLKKYRVELAPGMTSSVEFDPRTIITQTIGGIQLKAEPREGWEQRMYVKSK